MTGGPSIGLAGGCAVAARVALAAFGGYAVAALAAAWLAVVLPIARPEAVSAGTLASFAVMAAAVIWVFLARSLVHAAGALALVAAVLAGTLWLAGGFAATGAA